VACSVLCTPVRVGPVERDESAEGEDEDGQKEVVVDRRCCESWVLDRENAEEEEVLVGGCQTEASVVHYHHQSRVELPSVALG